MINRHSNKSYEKRMQLFHNLPALLCAIFLTSIIIRIVFVSLVIGWNSPPDFDGIFYDILAVNLLNGKGFVDSNGIPSAIRTPGYPLFLAGIYALAGRKFWFVRTIQILIDSGSVLIAYTIAHNLFNNRIGLLTAIGLTLHPLFIYLTGEFYSETLFCFLFFLSIMILVSSKNHNLFQVFLIGVILAFSMLVRPTMILYIPLISLWILFKIKNNPISWLNFIFFYIGVSVVFIPWIIRNYAIFNTPILSTYQGFNLWSGNNPFAKGTGVTPDISNWTSTKYPFPEKKWGGWNNLSEVQSDQRFSEIAIDWIRTNPDKFIVLIPKKIFVAWSPLTRNDETKNSLESKLNKIIFPFYLLFLFLAFYGLWISRKEWINLFPITSILIIVTLTAAIFFGHSRIGLPMALPLVIFASKTVDRILNLFT